jgi:manganese transport protein
MGEFANPLWVKGLAWTAAAIILALNVVLVVWTFGDWLETAGEWRTLLIGLLIAVTAPIGTLLVYITLHPVLPRWLSSLGRSSGFVPERVVSTQFPSLAYRRILVTLDHSERDRDAIGHGAALARTHGAKLYLVHVEEDVTSQLYGPEASTEEVRLGEQYFEDIVKSLKDQGLEAELVIRYAAIPSQAIVQVAAEIDPDLVVMAAHGHKGWKDIVLGTTINAVRHELTAPVLIVRERNRP